MIDLDKARALIAVDNARTWQQYYDKEIKDQVREAIAAGCTWQDVATVLGVTRQAAHERFKNA